MKGQNASLAGLDDVQALGGVVGIKRRSTFKIIVQVNEDSPKSGKLVVAYVRRVGVTSKVAIGSVVFGGTEQFIDSNNGVHSRSDDRSEQVLLHTEFVMMHGRGVFDQQWCEDVVDFCRPVRMEECGTLSVPGKAWTVAFTAPLQSRRFGQFDELLTFVDRQNIVNGEALEWGREKLQRPRRWWRHHCALVVEAGHGLLAV